jgi:ParB/RepB/Spo0J family partition protein
MSTKLDLSFGAVTRKESFAVDPRNLIPSQKNGRLFPVPAADVRKLADDLLASGQLNNIQITRFDDTPAGMYEVIAGNTRLAAAMLLIKDGHQFKIKCDLVKVDGRDKAFLMNLKENALRTDPSPVDTAANIDYMMNTLNMSSKEVASFYGKSSAWVTQTLKIHELDHKTKLALHNRILSQAAVWEMFDMTPEERATVLEYAPRIVEEKTGTETIPVAMTRAAKRAMREAATPEAAVEAVRNPFTPKKLKEIHAFFEGIATTDQYYVEGTRPELVKLCKDFLKWLDGRLRDDTMFEKFESFGYTSNGDRLVKP